MAQPYVGEIRLFAGNFAPSGWTTCDGQTLSIAQNQVLFTLLGTTYGGDGVNTFQLPNLAARVPIHFGSNGTTNYVQGQSGGVATVTIASNQLPIHSHTVVADGNAATTGAPANAYYALATPKTPYNVPGAATNPRVTTTFRTLDPVMLAQAGGGQPHSNLQPYLAITYIISLFGIFPSRN